VTARYVVWRLIQVLPAVAGIVLIGFLLIHLAPGDPILALAGESGDAEYYAAMRAKFGLDRPLPAQLAAYASNVLRGDMGMSYVHGRPAMDVITERLGATLLLAVPALALSSVLGIVLGAVSAARAGRPLDTAISAVTLSLYAAPTFWLAQMAVIVLALRSGLFPVQGMASAGSDAVGLGHAVDVAHHLLLPVLVLASMELAAVTRLTRVGVLEELGSDHVRTARAKGLTEGLVLRRHALRRPLLPVVTVIGNRAGHLLAGAVVVEVVFAWPGLGRLLITAVQARDSPIVLGIFMLLATGVVLTNLITDLVYGWLDPRITYG
jgi:peptide/nickel transport system permease protein